MISRLKAAWRALLAPGGPQEPLPRRALPRAIQDLADRLTACEHREAERTLAFENTRNQVLRYLQRVSAKEQRMLDREDQAESNGHQDPKQLAAVLRTKFHTGG